MADIDVPSYSGEFLRCEVGSGLYGLSLPGHGDTDLMGVRVEGMDEHVRLGSPFEQHVWRSAGGQNPSRAGDVDLTCYGLSKWLRLAVKGNPTVLNLLFVPPAHRVVDSALADELRALAPAILSRETAGRFLGYMHAQRERLQGVRGQKHTGADRKKYYVKAPGDDGPWDGKYGMHIIRLGVQGVELLSAGHIRMPMDEPMRSQVLAIRQGHVTKDEVLAWAVRLESGLLAFHRGNKVSPLADHPAGPIVESWMRETYLARWSGER